MNYWKTTHKYRVSLPNNVTEAMQIYQANGNNYWQDEIDKDTKKDKVTYEPRKDCTPEEAQKGKMDDIHGYQEITCYVIFDAKTDLIWKSRFVVKGRKTEAPVALNYSSVVSRDSVRLAFMIAALNDLDVMACDI